MTYAIEVDQLAKRFGTVQAVAGISLAVPRGSLFGFLGPNGAGKTTTITLLTGLARPDAGTIRIAGLDCTARPRAAQHLIGVVPDESNLYPELTGFENLCFCAALYGMGRAERQARARELLETFGLTQAGERKFGGYSKGMKRRLTVAAGIIHRPPILFLDEPTSGIDVASARQLRQLIATLRGGGTTVFLTTHHIEEAERLCDRVAFIVAGRVVREDTVDALLEPVRDRHALLVACTGLDAAIAAGLPGAFPDLEFPVLEPDRMRVEARAPIPVAPLVRHLDERGVCVLEARRARPTLEDVFVRVTGLDAGALDAGKGNGNNAANGGKG